MSKRLGGIIGCKDKTSSWPLIEFLDDGIIVTLGQQYHVEEKSTVILYTYNIDRHAGTPNRTKTKGTISLDYSSVSALTA